MTEPGSSGSGLWHPGGSDPYNPTSKHLIGVLSEQDCMKVALHAGYHGDYGGRVSDFMSTDVQTVNAEMSIVDLAQLFVDSSYRRFPVTQQNRLVGQISRRDVLRALASLSSPDGH